MKIVEHDPPIVKEFDIKIKRKWWQFWKKPYTLVTQKHSFGRTIDCEGKTLLEIENELNRYINNIASVCSKDNVLCLPLAIDPTNKGNSNTCLASDPSRYICTRIEGHKGMHVACGMLQDGKYVVRSHNFRSWEI